MEVDILEKERYIDDDCHVVNHYYVGKRVYPNLPFYLQDENRVYALNDYEIRKICKKERKKTTCIKNLKEKNINLLKGKRIKIPVIPFK